MRTAMSGEHQELTRQFLAWVAERPRTRAEVIDAWQSSCPRLAVWEDALADGLVRIQPGAEELVVVAPRGAAQLRATAEPTSLSARKSER